MELSPAALKAVFNSFNLLFKGAFDSAPTLMDVLATERTSGTSIENYAFLAKLPKFRQWVGERVWHNLNGYVQSVINLPFENGFAVDVDHIADDQLGLYGDTMSLLGESAKQWPDDLLVAALQAGTTSTVYDGQHFFDNSHPINMRRLSLGTQSNFYQTFPLTAANYEIATAAQASLVGENGEPISTRTTHLIVPPQLKKTGQRIVQALRDQYGADNVNAGDSELLVIPKLANQPAVWYPADLSKKVKPLVKQIRKAPRFVAYDQEWMPNVSELKELRYGVDARGAAGYGLWQLIFRCEG